MVEVGAMKRIRTTTGRVPDDGRHDAFWKEEDLYRLQSEVEWQGRVLRTKTIPARAEKLGGMHQNALCDVMMRKVIPTM